MDSEYLNYMDSGLNGIKSPDFSGFDLQKIRKPSFVKRSQVDIKGDAKKISQTLLTTTTFKLKFLHFWLIRPKKDTLSFMMSCCRPV